MRKRISQNDGGLGDPAKLTGQQDGDSKSSIGSNESTRGAAESPARDQGPELIAGFPAVSPGDIGDGSSGNGDRPRRKGRPPGARKAEKVSPDLNLAGIIGGLSLATARLMEIEELGIPKEEAEELATKGEKLLALYAKQFNAKALAWTEFALSFGSIVGPRVILGVRTISSRGASRRKAAVVEIQQTAREVSMPETKETMLSPSHLWPMGGGNETEQ